MGDVFNTMNDIDTWGYWFTYAKLRRNNSFRHSLWRLWIAKQTMKHRSFKYKYV